MDSENKPSALFVYFTYTNQTKKILDAMAEVLQTHGCDVTFAVDQTHPSATRSDSSRSR